MNKYNPNIHHRRSIRLKDYNYSQNGLYFITICTKNRECLFGEIINEEMQLNKTGKIIEKCWLEIPQHYPKITLHQHIVMPNHFHAIIEIAADSTQKNIVENAIVGVEYFRPNNSPNNQTKNIVENVVDNVGAEYFPPNNEISPENSPKTNGVDVRWVGIQNVGIQRVENIRPLQSKPRPNCNSGTLGAIIRGFKIGATKNIGFSVLQRNYHEHIIRNEKSLQIISEYIANNPAKWENDIFNPLNNK